MILALLTQVPRLHPAASEPHFHGGHGWYLSVTGTVCRVLSTQESLHPMET